MPFTVGENVGAYRITARLGQGGMATVFQAYHPRCDRYVAIKAMHAAFRQDPAFAQRFTQEADAVARLDHPNIVPVFEHAQHAGHPYLVMRFVEGETLKARLRSGPLSKDQIVQVAEQVGAALSYSHKEGVLHLDVKPSNVLLTRQPEEPHALREIYLTDFGLARIAGAGRSSLFSSMQLGTPQYMSPEQARDEQSLKPAADIYSLGVVLFELVTGRVPFDADRPFSVIHDQISTPPPLPTALDPSLSDRTEQVLLRALAKAPKDRHHDVDSFVTAFAESLQTEETGLDSGHSGRGADQIDAT